MIVRKAFITRTWNERIEMYSWLKAHGIEYNLTWGNGELEIPSEAGALLFLLRWGSK